MIKILVMSAGIIGLVLLAMSNPIYLRPEFLFPIGFGVFMLLVAVGLKLREFPSWYRARGKLVLDPIQLEELLLGSPPQILDLRPREDYVGPKGHIRNAVNIPMAELAKRLDELDTKHPRPLVLVDETDKVSHSVLPALTSRGHKWVYVLKGGMRAWRKAKLPVYVYQEKLKH